VRRETQKAADDSAAAARRELGLSRAKMKKLHALAAAYHAAVAKTAAAQAAAAALPRPASKRSTAAANADDGIFSGDESPAAAKPLKRGRAHNSTQDASPAPTPVPSGKRTLENPHPRAGSMKKPLAADGPDITPERFPPGRLSRRPKEINIVGLGDSDDDADAAAGDTTGAAGLVFGIVAVSRRGQQRQRPPRRRRRRQRGRRRQ
jgi:hypothetical protein